LKSDDSVSGTVVEADERMNVVLSGAKRKHSKGSEEHMESLTICGSSIRYAHIPRNVNVKTEVSDYIKTISRLQKNSRPRLIKDRAQREGHQSGSSKVDIVLN